MVVLLLWAGAVWLLVVALGVAFLVTRGRGPRDGEDRPVPTSPTAEESRDRLPRAGWSVGDVGTSGGG
jgi:hypothetical protein